MKKMNRYNSEWKQNEETLEQLEHSLKNMSYDIAKTKGRIKTPGLDRDFEKKVLEHQLEIVKDLKQRIKKLKKEKPE